MPPPLRPLRPLQLLRLPRPTSSPTIAIARPFTTTLRPLKSSDTQPTSSSSNLRPTGNFPPPGGNDPRAVFSELDVLSGLPTPASAVESILPDGFLLNNGQRVDGGDGVFLVNNDVFRWRPFPAASADATAQSESDRARQKGVIDLPDHVWGILDVVAPKPDLLVIGTGARTLLLHPRSRKRLTEMGVGVDVMDTHNAAAQYNLLATERPGGQVAGALLVAGFGK